MKSSRRKQTNPNRVAAGNRDLDPLATPRVDKYDASENQEDEMQDSRSGSDENCSPQPQMTNGQYSDFEQPLNMHVSVSSCSQCPEMLPSLRELQNHKAEVHGPELKKQRIEVSIEDFPTAYHRLGRELQERPDVPLANGHTENELPTAAPVVETNSSPQNSQHSLSPKLPPSGKTGEELPYLEPPQPPPPSALKSGKEASGEFVSNKSDRIFHMDAYCELCDREFCNKYFLKTHKANKHGIYEDSSPPASSVSHPFPSLMIPQDPLASFNFKMDSMKPASSEPLLPWSFKLDSPSQQPKKPESSLAVKNMDPPLPVFSLPAPCMESPKSCTNQSSSNNSGSNGHSTTSSSSSSSSSSATSMLTTITNNIKSGSSSNSAPPAHDPSMEDYCHICQKHFCNKYYLKKHKQDVHGIAPENPPSSSSKRSRSSLLDLPMASANHMMLPQPLAGLAGMHGLPGMPGLPSMPSMPPGVMVINPYSLPPVAIIPAGSLMPGQQIAPPPHPIISQPMSIAPLPDSALLPPPAPPTPASSASANSSEHSPSKPSPSLHEGGAHCNICSKEFCNEFYLQIHRESKHGIRRYSDDGPRGDRPIALVKESKYEKSSPPPLSTTSKSEPPIFTNSSLLDQSPTADGGFLYCNLCNKEFTNKYMYRIHRIHDHGLSELTDPTLIESGELQHKEDAMRCMNETLMRMTADASAVGYASSFGNSLSSKVQESVVCDICNKQITNQYFLRLHKFNVHGIDSSNSEKYDTKPPSSPVLSISKPKTPPSSGSLSISSTSQPLNLAHHVGKPHMLPFLPPKIDFKDMPPFVDFGRDFKNIRDVPSFLTDTISHELFARSHNQSRHLDINFFGLPPLGKLPSDDSAKLNFDPEAYCEICKKEFCSKYFLRTHKQNIHGIKCDITTSSSITKSSDSEKVNSFSPLKPHMSNNGVKSNDGQDKSSWRWKEPINSSRVICEICNKEVCNKYFLRTHKQKKHGIAPTSQSPNISMHGSPVASDCDTASNASSQPDDKPFRADAFSLPQMIPLPPTERISEKLLVKSPGKGKEMVHLNNNTEQSETCNICNQRFKNLNWLKDHIVKDHADTEALDMRSKVSAPVYTCQVCGVDFPAELSVQLHLIQEHNARVTLDTEEPQIPTEEASLPNGEGNSSKVAELSGRWTLRKKASSHRRLKKYVCTRCGFDSHWLSSLLDHERKEHGIVSGAAPVYTCKSCHHLFPTAKFLSVHMVIVHGFTSDDALHEVKSAEPTVPNSFRCAHCPAVFPTRSWGMAHVRHVHIRSRHDLAIKNSFEKSLLRCPSCSFKTHFAFRLQRHVQCRHRRSFRFSQSIYGSSSLIPTTPALQKLSDTISPAITSREDNSIAGANAMYKSIAASLLSSSESDRAESPAVDRKDLLLQSYKLPLGPSSVESTPFKIATQTSPASAVIGL